ncbi:MAG: M23 family metallopeptidase [Bacteroidia bacterium]|nr:M23 family metallopeptidase [Bacteroidia bacterium]
MRNHKTSILIINTEGKRNKTILVPTKLLLHWRKYFAVVVLIVFCLITALGFTIFHSTSEHFQTEIDKADEIKNLVNIPKAKQTFQLIDENIFRINKLLESRGLVHISFEDMGGPENIEVIKINELADFYKDQLSSLEKTLKEAPIGSPTLSDNIISKFGYRRNPFTGRGTEYHSGIDIKGKKGTPIKTTANGIVQFAGWYGGYGKCVIIKHENNLKTLYGHLSKITVAEGEKIECGQIIGKLGSTGRSSGPHLHYEIIKNDEKINPNDYFNFQ